MDFSNPQIHLNLCGHVRISDDLEFDSQVFSNIILKAEPSKLLETYRRKRTVLIEIFLKHFKSQGVTHAHPLCARSPLHIESIKSQIEKSVKKRVNELLL